LNKLTILLTFFCKITFAQTPILPLYDSIKDAPNAYYKDLQNDLNRFVGEWKYEQGSTQLIIRIQKKEMQFIDYGDITFYRDFLVAEYRYVENGIEKINTFSNLLTNHTNPYKYNMVGSIIIKPISTNPDVCRNCGPNDVMVDGTFNEPNRQIDFLDPRIIFRHKVENGVEKIFFTLYANGNVYVNENEGAAQNQFFSYSIPFGRYELIKQ
jgi:archaellum component FlaF (FlaF/FlaG flagellin family)